MINIIKMRKKRKENEREREKRRDGGAHWRKRVGCSRRSHQIDKPNLKLRRWRAVSSSRTFWWDPLRSLLSSNISHLIMRSHFENVANVGLRN